MPGNGGGAIAGRGDGFMRRIASSVTRLAGGRTVGEEVGVAGVV